MRRDRRAAAVTLTVTDRERFAGEQHRLGRDPVTTFSKAGNELLMHQQDQVKSFQNAPFRQQNTVFSDSKKIPRSAERNANDGGIH
jgi:hypothetical protein